jgi:glycosyltransferase involved in cell wall biosynthesis
MKIVIKATHITYGGGLTHLNKMIEWFGKIAPERKFLVLGKSGQERLFVEAPDNFEYRFYRAPSLNLFAQVFWERYRLPGIVKEIGCDLLFEPGNYGARGAHCPKVILIHNIAPFDNDYIKKENRYQKMRLKLLKRATISSMRSSRGIIFLSEYCGDFYSGYIDDSRQKKTVIFHGRPEVTEPLNDADVLYRYSIDGDYILSVSHIYRYKKIKELVQSYLHALVANPGLPPLYIAGGNYDREYVEQIKSIIKKGPYRDRVRFLGAVPEAELQTLYRNCRAFLFFSVLETCSVILIEAMTYGCPVACSNRGAIPEVTGGAALYFDPDDIEDCAFKIRAIIEDGDLNLFLRKKSLKRSEFFSWEKGARQTLDFFDEVLSMHNEGLPEFSEPQKVAV